MKTINKIFIGLGLAAAATGFSGCTGDLDLLPTDPNQTTAATFKDDPEKYLDEVFADVFLNFYTYGPGGDAIIHSFDGGMSTFQRAIFNMEEVPSDETNWIAEQDVNFGNMQFGIVDATNTAATAGYSRLMVNVALCVDFLRTVQDGYFNLESDALRAKADRYVLQVRALRNICYFYLLSCYGNVPYADESTPIGSTPSQLSRKEVYDLTVADLEDVVSKMSNDNVPYGYFGKDCAEAYLVKLYLNAEVFSGTAAWDKAYTHAKAIIDRHKGAGFQNSGLAMNYSQLFGQGNQKFTPGGGDAVQEILWSLPSKNGMTTSWGNSTLMIDAFLGEVEGYDCALKNYNSSDGWKCATAREQFVRKFDWKDAACSVTDDQRTRFWCTSAQNFAIGNASYIQANFGKNGYLPIKFTNWVIADDGTIDREASGPALANQFTVDYPMVRLAEVYLSAAEAILHGAGDKADALTYVNYIRQRAGLSPWNTAALTLETLQDERCRELYLEGTRRTDLIRYGKWISGYTWNWKGGVANGTDFPSNFNLYPLPSAVVVQTGYTQNPGY